MSVANSNEWSSNGIQYLFYAAKNGYYPYGPTGSISNGSSAGMTRLRGINAMEISEPDPNRSYSTGDNGVITAFLNQPTELPGGSFEMGAFNQTFAAKANGGTTIFTHNEWDIAGGFPLCFNYADLMFVANSPMNSQESSSFDEAGWDVAMILNAQVSVKTMNAIQSQTPRKYSNMMNIKRSTRTPWGVALATATHGSTAFSFLNWASPYPVKIHTIVGDNSATTFTLDETPTAAAVTAVMVWQAGSLLTYGAGAGNYTVNTSTKVLTFGTAPGTGVVAIVVYQFVPSC